MTGFFYLDRELVQPAPAALGLDYLSPNNFEREYQENTINTETQIILEHQ